LFQAGTEHEEAVVIVLRSIEQQWWDLQHELVDEIRQKPKHEQIICEEQIEEGSLQDGACSEARQFLQFHNESSGTITGQHYHHHYYYYYYYYHYQQQLMMMMMMIYS
jgi:hypothetical protein